MNQWNDIQIFSDNISTLRETSFDADNNVFMTELELQVVNFDDVKRAYLKQIGCQDEALTSVDALSLSTENFLFIEFKNGSLRKKETKLEINSKIQNSLLLLTDIVDCKISNLRNRLDFILVYNEAKNPHSSRNKINESLTKLANKEFIRFGLANYVGAYFREVHTYTKDEFERNISKWF